MVSEHTPLRFELRRNESAQGYDVVATGVQFGDGTVVMRWLGDHPSTQMYADWSDLMRIHHIGETGSDRWTTAVWLDGVCFACGGDLARVAIHSGGNGSQCCGCSATWDGSPSRKQEPELGVWKGIEMPHAQGGPDA